MAIAVRHSQMPLRAPGHGKTAPRGASRPQAKEPLRLRVAKINLSGIKRMLWPLLLAGLGCGAYALGDRMLPYIDRPVARVSVEGELRHITREVVQRRIMPFADARFFQVDLPGLRQDLEQMPWVARAEVRRIWPDQLQVRLDEQIPIARWGDESLLNHQGQAFVSEQGDYQHLPRLSGPIRAQREVMQQYQVLGQMLRPLGFSVSSLELRDRGSWFVGITEVGTDNKIELLLGRDHLLEKMRRLSTVYQRELRDQSANIAHIDLRYSNGLAVGWRNPALSAAADSAAN